MQLSDFQFFHPIRVRWSEVDLQAVVFNGHYLNFADVAFTEYWRATGLPDAIAQAGQGAELFVRHAELEFLAPAGFDQLLQIGVRCERIGNSSLRFVFGFFRDDQLLHVARLSYVYADTAAKQAKALPAAWCAIIRMLELNRLQENEMNFKVVLDSWEQLKNDAQAIRYDVFVIEQNIPAELEWDEMDAECLHAVAYDQSGAAVGTGRLLPDGHIGRMAVRPEARGSGVGAEILRALIAAARLRGQRLLQLNAQQSAQGFYAREGFVQNGEIFMEAGIAHICMELLLTED